MAALSEHRLIMAQLDLHGLDARVVLECRDAVFAAHAGLLIAAHGHFGGRLAPRVDTTNPRFQPMNHAMRTREIFRHDARGEAIRGAIRALDGFVFFVEYENAHDRPE